MEVTIKSASRYRLYNKTGRVIGQSWLQLQSLLYSRDRDKKFVVGYIQRKKCFLFFYKKKYFILLLVLVQLKY